MWFDRFTNAKCFNLPMQIESGRYIWEGEHAECLNGHSDIHKGELLVSDGSERCSLKQTTHQFLMPDKNRQHAISLFENAVTTIGKQLEQGGKLISPMLPSVVVDTDSHLLPLEKSCTSFWKKAICIRFPIDLVWISTMKKKSPMLLVPNDWPKVLWYIWHPTQSAGSARL